MCVQRGDSQFHGNLEFSSVFLDRGAIRITESKHDKHAHLVTGSWADEIPSLLDNDCIAILVLGGNEIPISALIATGSEFDIVLGDTPEDNRPPSAEIIPCSAVSVRFRKALFCTEHIEFAEQCQRTVTRTALLGPPPQLPAEAVRKRLPREAFFQEKLEELGLTPTDVDLVPDAVRFRLWRLQTDIYRSFAAEHDLSFIPPPRSTMDLHGMLARAYWGSDVGHPNAEFGEQYLRQVVEWASGRA